MNIKMRHIGLGLGGVFVLFLSYIGIQPNDYIISRSLLIQNTPAQIFPWMNNSRLAERWGPWLEADPQATMVYSGPEAGVGSKTSWDSQGQLGKGSATIIESIPNERIEIALEYSRPMTMTQQSTYLLNPEAQGTIVTWKVTGKSSFIGRLFCFFRGGMDKVVGGMFEQGLQNLKKQVENSSPAVAS